MRPASGRGLIRRVLVGLATIAVLAPPAGAYINGGDYHNTLDGYQKSLKAEGWGVSVGGPMSGHAPRGVVGLAFVPPDSPEHQRYVYQLVGRALRALPRKDASKVSAEAKREVARLTREAILQAAA